MGSISDTPQKEGSRANRHEAADEDEEPVSSYSVIPASITPNFGQRKRSILDREKSKESIQSFRRFLLHPHARPLLTGTPSRLRSLSSKSSPGDMDSKGRLVGPDGSFPLFTSRQISSRSRGDSPAAATLHSPASSQTEVRRISESSNGIAEPRPPSGPTGPVATARVQEALDRLRKEDST